MKIPCETHLTKQCFNSEFIEFVWQFQRAAGFHDQFICRIHKGPMIYMESGVIDLDGEYISDPVEFKLGHGHLDVGGIITSPFNWPEREFPSVYNYFTNGEDLIPLIAEVKSHFNSI